jgi:hypothetical protein
MIVTTTVMRALYHDVSERSWAFNATCKYPFLSFCVVVCDRILLHSCTVLLQSLQGRIFVLLFQQTVVAKIQGPANVGWQEEGT